MLISINGAYPIEAPHFAPWRDASGNPRTNPDEYLSDAAFMALGGAVAVSDPPTYDEAAHVLTWDAGWVVRENTPEETALYRGVKCAVLLAGITRWLDEVAQERLYDGIHALVGYVTSNNVAWKAEAQAGIAWRDGVWSALPAIQAEVMNGVRPIPTLDALKAELPQIVWPT